MTPADYLYDELCLSVYNTNRYFHRLYSRVLEPYDLSYLQYMSLLIIHQQGPLTLMAIGAALDLSSNTLTPVIDKLVKKSWLQKTPSPTDKRAKVLTMPADKQPLFAQILTEVDAVRDDLLARSGRPLEDVLRENQALNAILQTMLTEEKAG
ncbi:MarR family transcriptional regulator [Leuconostoc lactis]